LCQPVRGDGQSERQGRMPPAQRERRAPELDTPTAPNPPLLIGGWSFKKRIHYDRDFL